MKIIVEFESMEEFEAFRTSGKKTRTKKEEAEEAGTAPAPMQPPAGNLQSMSQAFNPTGAATGFAAPAAAATTPAGFPAAGAPTVAPEVQALVTRIIARLDQAVGMGQAADALKFFQGQCGPEAANFTLDQIKAVALPKLAVPALENIAKLMNA